MAETHEAAPGLLASDLLALAQAHEIIKPPPASSGSIVLNQTALQGGLRYGEITSIAGATGMGKTLVGCLVLRNEHSVASRETDF